MLIEIDLLLGKLKSPNKESDALNNMILEHFTSVGATQAKFLRTLKTIDFLFSKTNGNSFMFLYLIFSLSRYCPDFSLFDSCRFI